MTTKSEEKRINGLIEALETRHPGREGRDWMPWATNDHPLALEHWALVQRRLNLRYERTPAQKAAAEANGRRLSVVKASNGRKSGISPIAERQIALG
jgi:hypothetical protein